MSNILWYAHFKSNLPNWSFSTVTVTNAHAIATHLSTSTHSTLNFCCSLVVLAHHTLWLKISSVANQEFISPPPPSQRLWNLFMAHFCLVHFFPSRMTTHIFKALAVEPLDETAPLAFERACAELITAGSPGVDETNFLRHIRLVLVEVFSGEFFFDPKNWKSCYSLLIKS